MEISRRNLLKLGGATVAVGASIGSSGKVTPVKPVAPTTLKITPKGKAYRTFLKNPIINKSIEQFADLNVRLNDTDGFDEHVKQYDENKRVFRKTTGRRAFNESIQPARKKHSLTANPFTRELAVYNPTTTSRGRSVLITNVMRTNQQIARNAYADQIKLARQKISNAQKPKVSLKKPIKKRSLLHIIKKVFTKGR